MAAVRFTTIPCEPNTACTVQGKPHFYTNCSCAIGAEIKSPRLQLQNGLLHEAIFLATCNATFVAERCVASCQKKFTCNNPFCNCNCLASCKKSRTPSTFRNVARQVACVKHLHGNLQRNFVSMGQSELILAHPPSCLLLYALQAAKKVANVWHPLCNLKGFLFVIVALQVARKIASCNMALSKVRLVSLWVRAPVERRGVE